jgi:hypothetical protein
MKIYFCQFEWKKKSTEKYYIGDFYTVQKNIIKKSKDILKTYLVI